VHWLIELRFYVPPDKKYRSFWRRSSRPICWLSTEKRTQTQQKLTCIHASKNLWDDWQSFLQTVAFLSPYQWCKALQNTNKHCDKHKFNKMQPETADFAPGAATWWTGRNIQVIFDFGLLLQTEQRGQSVCAHACESRKTDEPIKMPFGELPHMDTRNHVLEGGQHHTNPFTAARSDKTAIWVHEWAV